MGWKICGSSALLLMIVLRCQAARILVFIPTAGPSHQVVAQVLSKNLALRGHEVVHITTDPVYPKGEVPTNLTEIDVHDASYAEKKLGVADTITGHSNDVIPQLVKLFQHSFTTMFEGVIKTQEVQNIINDRHRKFDLLILEACTKVALIFSHIFDAPVILISSFGNIQMFNDYTGSATHPLLFPTVSHQKLYNLTLWEKIRELYKHFYFEYIVKSIESEQDVILQNYFGPNTPSLRELKNNVAMVFLSEHHLWDHNRPVPQNMVYIGGIYPQHSTKRLPMELELYLNASANGVIYVSFGTNILTSLMPKDKVQIIIKVLSQLPYDILLKWDTHHMPGKPQNVKLFKWAPQPEVLRHPKIKLFITQGGKQSTDDAIAAGVPLVGMPMLGDQWYNIEQYLRFNIGLKVDMEFLSEETMLNAINTVLNNASYRQNVVQLRKDLMDQPQSPLERATWWCEYVIRHKGAPHLRAPTALISNWDYFEGDLIMTIIICMVVLLCVLVIMVYCIFLSHYKRQSKTKFKPS